jgi:hypothetical protein
MSAEKRTPIECKGSKKDRTMTLCFQPLMHCVLCFQTLAVAIFSKRFRIKHLIKKKKSHIERSHAFSDAVPRKYRDNSFIFYSLKIKALFSLIYVKFEPLTR